MHAVGSIDELRKLGQEATEGPWKRLPQNKYEDDLGDVWAAFEEGGPRLFNVDEGTYADAQFIATARNVWDEMCAALKACEGVIAGIHTDNDQQFQVVADHFALRVDDARRALTRLKNIDQEQP